MISPATILKIRQKLVQAKVMEKDLQESFVLGSGPGGQKINKTSSTVRLCHVPSGVMVKVGRSRSRETNRWLARRELAERILELERIAISARQQTTERIRRQKRRRLRRRRSINLQEKKFLALAFEIEEALK